MMERNKGTLYYSCDGDNYKKVGKIKDIPLIVPKLSDNAIIDEDEYKKFATLGENEFTFKIKDKYYLIYCRTKKRRIKKKQLKRMNTMLAMSLGIREYFKGIKADDIEIKVGECQKTK